MNLPPKPENILCVRPDGRLQNRPARLLIAGFFNYVNDHAFSATGLELRVAKLAGCFVRGAVQGRGLQVVLSQHAYQLRYGVRIVLEAVQLLQAVLV